MTHWHKEGMESKQHGWIFPSLIPSLCTYFLFWKTALFLRQSYRFSLSCPYDCPQPLVPQTQGDFKERQDSCWISASLYLWTGEWASLLWWQRERAPEPKSLRHQRDGGIVSQEAEERRLQWVHLAANELSGGSPILISPICFYRLVFVDFKLGWLFLIFPCHTVQTFSGVKLALPWLPPVHLRLWGS